MFAIFDNKRFIKPKEWLLENRHISAMHPFIVKCLNTFKDGNVEVSELAFSHSLRSLEIKVINF